MVLPAYELDIWNGDDVIQAGGLGDAAITDVTVLVTDSQGNVLPNVQVQFTTSLGQFVDSGNQQSTAATDADGYAQIKIQSGAAGTAHITATIPLATGAGNTIIVTTDVVYQ